MPQYTAPLKDMLFVLNDLVGLDDLSRLPGLEEANRDTAAAVLESAARFAADVLSPLNPIGDREGVRYEAGRVFTPPGFRQAYAQFVADGWNSLAENPEYGGQGLPTVIAAFVDEMWQAANLSFGGCATLTKGAIRAIESNASTELKRLYLPALIRGDWTGTMNLTEPQAGSDLSDIRARAVRADDGAYRLFGQKIYISWGAHDLTDNIVHLVLARTADAPPGVKGLSLFLVPNRLILPDGYLGRENDVRCVSIEDKLGQHAAPNTVLSFGGNAAAMSAHDSGAIGFLIGEECQGITYMFVMMNEARFGVGIEGIGLADRAYQAAAAYARDRIQGTEAGSRSSAQVPIIRHPDVRRMLLWMRSHVEAERAIAGIVAAAMDKARCHPSVHEREHAAAMADLLIPVVKGWSTENAVDITSLCVQVHGGAGYIENVGAAQYFRDSRILPIYEGTTGIQANDLVGRKIAKDGGRTIRHLCGEMIGTADAMLADDSLTEMSRQLRRAVAAVDRCIEFVVQNYEGDRKKVLAGAVPLLRLFGSTVGGWLLSKSALVARQRLTHGCEDPHFMHTKILTARFFAGHVLELAEGLAASVTEGSEPVLAIADAHL